MYCVKGDGIIIYNDIAVTESAKAVSPKLTLSDNAAGSLEITLPPGNAGYSSLKHMKSVITVFRNNEEIWSGRIVSEKKDFWNNRVLTCEGELAYLNDTLQPPKQYSSSEDSGVTVLDFLTEVIKIHNQNADDEKQFYVDESYIFNYSDVLPIVCTNYESTLDTINTNLIEYFGGHIQVKKKDGKRYLYFFKDGINTNTQVIRFGQNLLDFT